MPLPTGLTQDELNNVAFENGVDSTGTVIAQNGWSWDGDVPATYSAASGGPYKWAGGAAGTSGGVVTYDFDAGSNWTTNEMAVWKAGLALWADLANVAFTQVTTASAAKLVLYRNPSTSAPANQGNGSYESTTTASRSTVGGKTLAATSSAYISIQTGNAGDYFNFDNTFANLFAGSAGGLATVIHELGHSLGLAHTGPYNGTVNTNTQQFSPVDTTLFSIMSYISPTDASAKYYAQRPVTGTNWGVSGNYARGPETPQLLDIAAVQQLYGASTTSAFAGGQTYGFNCNIAADVRPFFDFTVNTAPVITISNRGTGNTLDLSGYGMACTVNLNPGTFSSVGGLANNVGVAAGTKLDTVVGGTGDDVVYENTDGDTVDGGAGSNTFILRATRLAYTMTRTPDDVVTVTTTSTGVKDTLTRVAALQFSDGTTMQTSAIPLCFRRGTRIAVPGGHALVERLRPGMPVLTADGPARPVRWIGRRSYAAPFLARNPGVQPIRIRAGAVADGVPARDLFVSPRHALFLDGLLVPAEALVNGATVTRCTGDASVEYVHVELDSHDVLLAEGCPAESYADIGTRGLFQNAATFAAMHPDAAGPVPPLAPLTEGGDAFEALRRRLHARAGLDLPDPASQAGAMAGGVDAATHHAVAGWARVDGAAPLRLEVLDNGRVVGRVTANLMRADVRDAGHGDGRCGFVLDGLALDPHEAHRIEVRRSSDGALLAERALAVVASRSAPAVPSLAAVQAMLAAIRQSAQGAAEIEALARLLDAEAGRLREARAA